MFNASRRGATLVFIAIALPVFLFVAVMAVDIAYMQLIRTEHRAAIDAAAKAGAEALSRNGDAEEATEAAIAIAAQNRVGGKIVELDAANLEFGRAVRQDDGSWSFEEGAEPFTSVRVNSQLSGTSAVRLLLGSIMGVESFTPQRSSTAAYSLHDVCLAVDRSHSMCFSTQDESYPIGHPMSPSPRIYPPHATDSRWASLEQAISVFVNTVSNMDTSQHVGLVTWGSYIPPTDRDAIATGLTFEASELDVPLGDDYSDITQAITQRGDNPMLGATDMSAGIDRAIQELTGANARPHATKTMILMTDGQWNRGRDPVQAALDAKAAGITIHTITFLDGADQEDMIDVANATGGRHFHATDGEALQQVFYELAISLPVVLTE